MRRASPYLRARARARKFYGRAFYIRGAASPCPKAARRCARPGRHKQVECIDQRQAGFGEPRTVIAPRGALATEGALAADRKRALPERDPRRASKIKGRLPDFRLSRLVYRGCLGADDGSINVEDEIIVIEGGRFGSPGGGLSSSPSFDLGKMIRESGCTATRSLGFTRGARRKMF